MEEVFKISEITLDLMDYKGIEANAEHEIREAKRIVMLGEITRKEAKKMIKKFGGLTSEEERAEAKKKQ